MGADELFDCESFKAIATENGNSSSGELEQELTDRREEYASQYERVSLRATVKQADYIRILCNGGWLTKADFPSQHEFFRKTSLSYTQAHALITLGKKRMAEDRHWKSVAREQGW